MKVKDFLGWTMAGCFALFLLFYLVMIPVLVEDVGRQIEGYRPYTFCELLKRRLGCKVPKVLRVSKWVGVFDVDCSCGAHLHWEPYDPEHYKIVCATCDKVYEKGWDVWQKEMDRWEYIFSETVNLNKEGQTLIGTDETDPNVLVAMNALSALLSTENQIFKFITKDYFIK